MGSAIAELPMIDQRVINLGHILHTEDKIKLCQLCSVQEVKEALFQMDSNKAPDIDSYNVYFFKKAWYIIRGEITEAMQQLFVTGFLSREVNLALITLIPKCENASAAKEFRPIACCTILYKIISKILANRLMGVLDTIISTS